MTRFVRRVGGAAWASASARPAARPSLARVAPARPPASFSTSRRRTVVRGGVVGLECSGGDFEGMTGAAVGLYAAAPSCVKPLLDRFQARNPDQDELVVIRQPGVAPLVGEVVV